jgi:peroxiredoxin
LRQDHQRFVDRGATVVAIGPHSADEVAKHLKQNPTPFALLPDADGAVFAAYDVPSRLMSLGQQPATFVIDRTGIIRFDAVGAQQWNIPSNATVLEVLDKLGTT